MNTKRNQIGLNIASLLPWVGARSYGLGWAAEMSRRIGFKFWQVMPLRVVTAAKLAKTGMPIGYVENAWNATTFWRHFLGRPGTGGPTKLHDPLFFPSPKICNTIFVSIIEEFEAQPIFHRANQVINEGLLEIHPGLNLSLGSLLEWAKSSSLPRPLVLDTKHFRRSTDKNQYSPFHPWRESLALLISQVGLVHVQALNREELEDFIRGKNSELARMLRLVLDLDYKGDLLVELDPTTFGFWQTFPTRLLGRLMIFRLRVEEILKQG